MLERKLQNEIRKQAKAILDSKIQIRIASKQSMSKDESDAIAVKNFLERTYKSESKLIIEENVVGR